MRLRVVLSRDLRRWLYFEETGGFVCARPVIQGGDGTGGDGGGSGSGGEGGTGDGDGGAGGTSGSGAGEGGAAGGTGDGAGDKGSGDQGGDKGKGQEGLSTDEKAELERLRADDKKNKDELKRARDDAAKYRTEAQKRALEKSIATLKDAGVDTTELEKQLNEGGGADASAAVAAAAAQEKAEKEKLAIDLKQRDIKDAVRDAADDPKVNANFKLLYGYLTAEGALTQLDPSADDFQAKVDKLVQDTIKKEPSLKKGQGPSKSGTDLNGGGPSEGQPKSLEDAVSAHYSE